MAKQYKVLQHSLSSQRWEGVGAESLRKFIIHYHLEIFNQGTNQENLLNLKWIEIADTIYNIIHKINAAQIDKNHKITLIT